eukprot:TRINITY_DN2525_c0_g1_i3.p1 TRINITY_DN2525_c0_g1~~TRINITY_DN2525_c0_g1_i3.p1  ORF type:complete len:431 (-),score=73.77 TRINITY_DN2525_c0_g1_i3:221-1513(-)
MVVLYLAIFLAAVLRSSAKVSYAGFSVLQAGVHNDTEMLGLERESGCSVLTEWSTSGIGFLCDRYQSNRLRRAAKAQHINTRFSARHLDRLIREEEQGIQERSADAAPPRRRANRVQGRSLNHNSYVDVATIYRYLGNLQSRYPNVQVRNFGKTFEGRDLKVVVVNGGKGLPKIFMDAGIHAREWISPAATLYFIDRLTKVLNRRRTRSTVPTIGSKYEWHIIPVANPDGYEYSRNSDRMWRKNRRRFSRDSSDKCVGVDLNRNFPQGYGIGASKSKCSEVYQGPNPFSEAESKAMKNYIAKLQNVKIAVSVHSFGNVLIYPWGYTSQPHPNQKELHRIASKVSDAIKNITGEYYQPGTAKQVFGNWGIAGGATDDYYITKGIRYSFTVELPEKDTNGKEYGFLLPPSNIKRVGRQLSAALTTLAINADN